MSYFRNPGTGLDEQDQTGAEPDELLGHEARPLPRVTFGELAGRVGRWFQGIDVEPGDPLDGETAEHDMLGELAGADETAGRRRARAPVCARPLRLQPGRGRSADRRA